MDAIAVLKKANQASLETLVKTHAALVKRIAYHLLAHVPASVPLEDLIQVGMIGLMEAAKHYDASKGASFETYANIRIRGFMLDELRENDWIPRSVYRNARMIASAVKNVENRLGRSAYDREIAGELEMDVSEFYELLKDSAGSQLQGFEDLGITDDKLMEEEGRPLSEPDSTIAHTDLMNKLSHIISGLPPTEKMVLSLYYEHDLNLKEIGEVLSVSESRVSQIHTQATLRIKSRFLDA